MREATIDEVKQFPMLQRRKYTDVSNALARNAMD
jgi:hypothetical protein